MQFLDFPDEIILAICSNLDNVADIWKLAQCSRRLSELLEHAMYKLDAEREDGEPRALMWAVFNDTMRHRMRHGIISKAKSAGANINVRPRNPLDDSSHSENDQGRNFSLLTWAVRKKKRDLTASLLHLGADINIGVDDGTAPVLIATRAGDVGMMNMLLLCRRVDRGARFANGPGLVTAAVLSGSLCALRCILNHGFDPNESGDGLGCPLYMAIGVQNYDMVDLLLSHESIDPNITVKMRAGLPARAFAYACGKESLEIVSLLHDSGKVDVNAECIHNFTPAKAAHYGRRIENMEYLLTSDKCTHANDILFELACEEYEEELAKWIVGLTPLRSNAHKRAWMDITRELEFYSLTVWIRTNWRKT